MGVEQYFFDTYALFAIVQGNSNYENYKENQVIMTVFNLVELYYQVLRDYGEKKAKEIYHHFEDCVIEIEEEVVSEAMNFRLAHKQKRLSYADCIGYFCAKKNNILFLTGDMQFQNFENVEFVKA